MMYTSTWQTSLWACDSESCILSFILPCHIYSKISNGYASSFIIYGSCVLSVRLFYYWCYVLYNNACPSNYSDQCLGLGNACSSYYTTIDGTPTSCMYRNDISACTYNIKSCIQVHNSWYTWAGISCSIIYLFIFLMNYTIRKKVRIVNFIQDGNDICESTCLSPCGLAQAYREIV
jgi:hypothetical protein